MAATQATQAGGRSWALDAAASWSRNVYRSATDTATAYLASRDAAAVAAASSSTRSGIKAGGVDSGAKALQQAASSIPPFSMFSSDGMMMEDEDGLLLLEDLSEVLGRAPDALD